jgi:hypothetical protein
MNRSLGHSHEQVDKLLPLPKPNASPPGELPSSADDVHLRARARYVNGCTSAICRSASTCVAHARTRVTAQMMHR